MLARDPAGYARLADVITRRRWPGEKGEARCYDGVDWARRPRRGTGWCSPGAARAPCPRRWSSAGPAAAERELRRLVDAFGAEQRRGRAVGPRRPARLGPQRRPGRHRRPGRGRGAWPPTTSTTPPRPERRLATALAAVRARRSLDELDGWLPAGGRRPPALGRRAGPPLRPLPGGGRAGRRAGPGLRLRPALVAPDLPPFPCPPGPDGRPLTEMAYLRRLVEEGADAPLRPPARRARAPGRGTRSTTSSPSSRRSASPATSSSCGTSSSSAAGRTSTARAGDRPPTRRSASPSASPRPTRWRSACCSSGSCRPSATARPTSTSTSSPTGARRSSSTSTSATAAATPPRWPTSSPTGPAPRSATWPRRWATPPASRTPGPSGSTAGAASIAGSRQVGRPDAATAASGPHPRRRCSTWRPRSSTSPATWASTPGGMVHLRPAGGRGVPGRVGPLGREGSPRRDPIGPSCSGTRTTAPPPAW